VIPIGDLDLSRPVLRDPDLQREFAARGYVVVDLLDPDEVQVLYDGYATVADTPDGVNPPGAYNDTYAEFSVIHSRPGFRREAFELISQVLRPHADEWLDGYRPLYANYVNKPPGSGVVPAHQNFSVVDETRFQSVSVWVALVDCVVSNGAMWMGDGSHKALRGPRGMWSYQAFTEIDQQHLEELLSPVAVTAGQAVILDDAIVHYSPPNQTGARRLAIQFVMVPDEADAMWFHQVGQTDDRLEVDIWKVEEGYFFELQDGVGDPRYGEVVDRIEVPAPRFDLDTLRGLIDAGDDAAATGTATTP
jgi:hypothetical protein